MTTVYLVLRHQGTKTLLFQINRFKMLQEILASGMQIIVFFHESSTNLRPFYFWEL